MNKSTRRHINGIWFESQPRAGYAGYWTTDNGRVHMRKRKERTPWHIYVDGKRVGAPIVGFVAAIHSNEWAIRKGL